MGMTATDLAELLETLEAQAESTLDAIAVLRAAMDEEGKRQ